MTIAVTTFDPHGVGTVEDPADISEAVDAPGNLVWVDVLDPSDDDFACLQAEFALHPLAMEDARKHGQRPKLEQYPTHAFLVAYDQHLAEVDLFIGPTWLVSVRGRSEDGHVYSLDAVRARFLRTRGEDVSVGLLLHAFLDDLVDGYFTTSDELEDAIETFEEKILADDPDVNARLQTELLVVRRRLVEFRRRVVPVRDVLAALLRREVPWVEGPALVQLQDVHDHVLRAIDQLDAQRELVGNAMDAHLALMSNRMNEVMKRMTSWGAILVGATLISSIYGMNFEHMPELEWRLGYPFALALMGLFTVTAYRAFKRRDWL